MTIRASVRSALIIAAGIWIGFCAPSQAQQVSDPAQATAEPAQPVALGKPIALNKYTRHHSRRARHSRRHASSHSHRHSKVAKSRSKASKTVAKAKADEPDKVSDDKAAVATMSPSVADAKAQMIDSNTTVGNASSADKGSTVDAASTTPQAQPEPAQANNQPTPAPAIQTTPPKPNDVAAAQPEAAAPGADSANVAVVPPEQFNDIDRAMNDTKEPAPTMAMAAVSDAQTTAVASSSDDSAWGRTSMVGKIFIAFGGLLTLASAARMLIA